MLLSLFSRMPFFAVVVGDAPVNSMVLIAGLVVVILLLVILALNARRRNLAAADERARVAPVPTVPAIGPGPAMMIDEKTVAAVAGAVAAAGSAVPAGVVAAITAAIAAGEAEDTAQKAPGARAPLQGRRGRWGHAGVLQVTEPF